LHPSLLLPIFFIFEKKNQLPFPCTVLQDFVRSLLALKASENFHRETPSSIIIWNPLKKNRRRLHRREPNEILFFIEIKTKLLLFFLHIYLNIIFPQGNATIKYLFNLFLTGKFFLNRVFYVIFAPSLHGITYPLLLHREETISGSLLYPLWPDHQKL
jgi:hypothetical protein